MMSAIFSFSVTLFGNAMALPALIVLVLFIILLVAPLVKDQLA
jgi:hypothetical protein